MHFLIFRIRNWVGMTDEELEECSFGCVSEIKFRHKLTEIFFFKSNLESACISYLIQ